MLWPAARKHCIIYAVRRPTNLFKLIRLGNTTRTWGSTYASAKTIQSYMCWGGGGLGPCLTYLQSRNRGEWARQVKDQTKIYLYVRLTLQVERSALCRRYHETVAKLYFLVGEFSRRRRRVHTGRKTRADKSGARVHHDVNNSSLVGLEIVSCLKVLTY